MEIVFYLLLGFNLIVFLIILFNFLSAPKLHNKKINIKNEPFISVLIPARNEEENILACLDSVNNQNYKNYEIIVLDDNSSDNTYNLVKQIELKNDKIKLIKGKPLPEGWKGKNWACNLLSKQAKGEYLLFMDADVKLMPNTLLYSIYLFNKFKLNVLSAFPTQITKSFGERIIVPLMKWLLLSFLPLKLVYKYKNEKLIAANGQFIMFKKEVYDYLGGHKSVKDNVVEDMEFALLTKRNNFKLMTTLGNDAVFCKMYNSFSSAYWGFSKNYFQGFKMHWLPFLLLQLFFLFLFVSPFIISLFNVNFLTIVFIILLGRVLLAINTKDSIIFSILMHIIQIIVLALIAFNSVISLKKNRILWKGRKV